MENSTEKQCSNCNKMIPEDRLDVHEAYCVRKMTRCAKCKEMILKEEVEEHEQTVHGKKACPHCNLEFEQDELPNHMEKACRFRPITCSFCHGHFTADKFKEHAYHCGSRTDTCQYCNKNVIKRELEAHEEMCMIEVAEGRVQPHQPAQPEDENIFADRPYNNEDEEIRASGQYNYFGGSDPFSHPFFTGGMNSGMNAGFPAPPQPTMYRPSGPVPQRNGGRLNTTTQTHTPPVHSPVHVPQTAQDEDLELAQAIERSMANNGPTEMNQEDQILAKAIAESLATFKQESHRMVPPQ